MLPQPYKLPTLHSVVVELAAADVGYIPPTLSRALHALVLKWIALDNSEMASIIHASQNSPLSISSLLGNRRPSGTEVGDFFYFRIGILDGSIIEPLLSGFEQSETQKLVLANFPFVLRNIYALPGTHRLARAAISAARKEIDSVRIYVLDAGAVKKTITYGSDKPRQDETIIL